MTENMGFTLGFLPRTPVAQYFFSSSAESKLVELQEFCSESAATNPSNVHAPSNGTTITSWPHR
jgi:hypothetical protein